MFDEGTWNYYIVDFGDGEKAMINPHLVEEQELTDEDIEEIRAFWNIRHSIEKDMESLDPQHKGNKVELKKLLKVWTENEFNLQEAWKFDKNADYHKWWHLPHCTCPKMDNDDNYPTGLYYMMGDCPYHGTND